MTKQLDGNVRTKQFIVTVSREDLRFHVLRQPLIMAHHLPRYKRVQYGRKLHPDMVQKVIGGGLTQGFIRDFLIR